MSEYLMLYRRSPEVMRQTMGSPEQAERTMKKWRAWFEDLTAKGQLKSPGQPLDEAGRVVGGRKATVSDGPYMETKDVIGGYSTIEARDLDQAATIAAGCPLIEAGGFVEVRPVRQLTL